MNKPIKFTMNKPYFLFLFFWTLMIFLSSTLTLLFGDLIAKDIPPLIAFGVLSLLVIILNVNKYFVLAKSSFTALELTQDEIIDRIGNVVVKWDNVAGISFIRSGRAGYISIVVSDKKQVMMQTQNIFKKAHLLVNTFLTGSPVKVVPIYIKGKNVDIFNTLYTFYQERASNDW